MLAPWLRPRRLCRGIVTEGAALEPRGLALRADELGLAGRHAGGDRVRRGRGAQVDVLEAEECGYFALAFQLRRSGHGACSVIRWQHGDASRTIAVVSGGLEA